MPDRRIHLREYPEQELREMPAGPLADWLVAQADGQTPIRRDGPGWGIGGKSMGQFWADDASEPDSLSEWDMPSTEWSAAGPLLQRLMREHFASVGEPVDGEYRVQWTKGNCFGLESIYAPSPQLAICRACLAIARRKLDAKETQ